MVDIQCKTAEELFLHCCYLFSFFCYFILLLVIFGWTDSILASLFIFNLDSRLKRNKDAFIASSKPLYKVEYYVIQIISAWDYTLFVVNLSIHRS